MRMSRWASIAKVREDKSLIDNADTSELLSEEEEKESAAIAAENAKKASVENTETDDEADERTVRARRG